MPTPNPQQPPTLQQILARLRALSPRKALAALLALATLVTVTVTVVDEDGPDGPAKPHVVVTVHTLDAKGDPAPVQAPAAAVKVASAGLDSHADGSGDVKPPDVPQSTWTAGQQQLASFASRDAFPATVPLAAPNQPGCTTHLITTNFTAIRLVTPRLIVVHYTVSPNLAGWADVNGNIAWFNSPRAQASSNYIIDADGHCAYIVPETAKAWAQVGFNSAAISIEVINTGKEPRLAAAAGMAKIGRVISDAGKRWGIPLRRGKVSGCSVVASGIVDHNQLGACGGGHFDITPYSVPAVIAAATKARGGSSAASAKAAKERASTCSKLRYHRRKLKAHAAGQVAQIKALKAHAKAIGLDETKCRA